MEKGMKIVCLSALLVASIIVLTYSVFALTLSCSLGTTCPYPGVAVAYLQNETGGFDNAHIQNGSAVSLEGLLAWYRLDNMSFAGENGTRVFDWSGSGNNGTPTSGAVADTNGKLNGRYVFDGVNDLISVPYSASLAPRTGNFSISAWFNAASLSGAQRIVSKTETGGYQLSINENGVCSASSLCFAVYNGTQYYTTSIPTSGLTTNRWYHVIGVYNGTQLSLYLNGTLASSSTTIRGLISYSTNNELCIGSEPGATCNAGAHFNGSIDELMIFNRSLSSQEVSNLYDRTFYTYNNALCCTADTTLSNSCTVPQATALRISNYTNAHAQIGSYGGTQYPVPVCLSASAGKVQCAFPTATCAAGYTCLGSIASSEQGDLNLTNAHVASCNEYPQKICCRLNTPPVVSNVILNSTLRTNLTTENLSVYFTQTDADSDVATNITDWRVNGTSIAVLNLPLDTEETSTTTDILRDYSTHGNNGTPSGNVKPTWNASGKMGGSYYFYGNQQTSYIAVGDHESLNFDNWTNFSMFAWVRTDPAYNANRSGWILSKNGAYAVGQGYQLHASYPADANMNKARCNVGKAGGPSVTGSTLLNDSQWHFVGCVRSGQNLSVFVDGRFESSTTTSSVAHNVSSTAAFLVGSYGGFDPQAGWKGWIDQVYVFNRSLSAGQAIELYNAGVNNLSLQKIHSDETLGGENWTCAVTPNDGRDGNTLLSNSLVIRNSAPTVVLTHPADNNVTTNRTPMFNWTGTDPDGNPLTYEINITAMLVNGTSLCSDVRTVSTGTNNYYIPSGDLLCLSDNQMVYKWSARASDGGEFGPWSSTRTLNISAYVAVSLPTNSVEFGSISVLQSNDTTDDAPLPFTIQNDGTVLLNVNISASDLWSSIASPNEYYRFKVANVSNETGAFNWSGSVTEFTNFSTTGRPSISGLNYSDSRDIARTDIYVAVPSNEPPAVRNSTVTFMSILGES